MMRAAERSASLPVERRGGPWAQRVGQAELDRPGRRLLADRATTERSAAKAEERLAPLVRRQGRLKW